MSRLQVNVQYSNVFSLNLGNVQRILFDSIFFSANSTCTIRWPDTCSTQLFQLSNFSTVQLYLFHHVPPSFHPSIPPSLHPLDESWSAPCYWLTILTWRYIQNPRQLNAHMYTHILVTSAPIVTSHFITVLLSMRTLSINKYIVYLQPTRS